MKTDKDGCSTCPPGEEQYEEFKQKTNPLVQYDYRTKGGELFSCIDVSLEQCRKRRDEWLVSQGLTNEEFDKFCKEEDKRMFLKMTAYFEECKQPKNVNEEFDKFYKEQGYPECQNNSDMMDAMTVEDFKYNVVGKAFLAGMELAIKKFEQ